MKPDTLAAAGDTATTPASIVGISPFFIVKDIADALAFYREKLGFEVTFKSPRASRFLR